MKLRPCYSAILSFNTLCWQYTVHVAEVAFKCLFLKLWLYCQVRCVVIQKIQKCAKGLTVALSENQLPYVSGTNSTFWLRVRFGCNRQQYLGIIIQSRNLIFFNKKVYFLRLILRLNLRSSSKTSLIYPLYSSSFSK